MFNEFLSVYNSLTKTFVSTGRILNVRKDRSRGKLGTWAYLELITLKTALSILETFFKQDYYCQYFKTLLLTHYQLSKETPRQYDLPNSTLHVSFISTVIIILVITEWFTSLKE